MARVAGAESRNTIDQHTGELLAARCQVYSREVRGTNSTLTRRKRGFSDRTITASSKYIQQELVPDDEGDIDNSASILPLKVIEDVVK